MQAKFPILLLSSHGNLKFILPLKPKKKLPHFEAYLKTGSGHAFSNRHF